MLPKKTALAAAGTMVMVIVTITTAIALNIGLLQAAQPSDSGASTTGVTAAPEPQVRTVVVEVPGEGAALSAQLVDQSLGAPVGASAPAPVPARAVVQAAAAAAPAATQAAAPVVTPGSSSPPTQAPPTQAPATQAPATQAPATQAPATQAPATQAPATQAPATQAPTTAAPVVQTEYLTFPMGDIGPVVVANHGGQSLEFWSASPSGGWRFEVEKTTGKEIEIKFENDGDEAKMKVELSGGKVSVEREGI
ncbi:MAG: hypothetical protein GY929_04360 [Actinomycetia bacterium]|nr:hypothetical protein [Actinomycetes bacterium]